MSWYNPASWGRAGLTKATTLTLDQAIARLDMIRNTASGIRVTPDSAMQAPTVYAIVNSLSRAVASLPFMVLDDDSEQGKRRVRALPDHNVTRLLRHRPNAWQTPYDYWQLVMHDLLLHGRFYAKKQQAGNGRIVRLQPLAPDKVTPKLTQGGGVEFTVQLPDGKSEDVPQAKMHWISGLMGHALKPLTPINQCKESIALEIAAEEFGAATFGSGAIPNVVLKRKGHFKDQTALDRFRETWTNAFQKRRGTAVLEDDLDMEVVQMTNEDSQFLETRKFQRTVIAGAFGVPPHLIGDLERATFSNIEHMSLNFIIHLLRPWLTNIEAAIARDLLTEREVLEGVQGRFDTKAMLRGDAKSTAEALQIERQMGIINANEWREMTDRDAREDDGGDDYMTPLNFRLEDINGIRSTEPAPAPTPDP